MLRSVMINWGMTAPIKEAEPGGSSKADIQPKKISLDSIPSIGKGFFEKMFQKVIL